MARTPAPATGMVEQIGRAIARADGVNFEHDPERFRRLALAAIEPVARPTKAMVDAAHEAVSFDGFWAVNSGRDFRKAVRAMIDTAMAE